MTKDEQDEIVATLNIEANLTEEDAEHGRPASRHQAGRLRLLARRIGAMSLHDSTHGVDSEKMEFVHPVAKNAIAKTKSDAPMLHKVLEAGWSVRYLTEKVNKLGVDITHAYLGRMLKGQAPMRDDVKKAIRVITKVRL